MKETITLESSKNLTFKTLKRTLLVCASIKESSSNPATIAHSNFAFEEVLNKTVKSGYLPQLSGRAEWKIGLVSSVLVYEAS